MNYQEYIKERRLGLRLTLRGFARQLGMDPSNWSKIERGISAPPNDPLLVHKIGDLLALDDHERQDLSDLADVARGQIPADLQDSALMAKMPAFFRAMRGQEYTLEDIEKMKQSIRQINS